MSAPFADWIGRQETRHDHLDTVRCNALFAALGRSEKVSEDDALPALHHWLHFWDVRPPAGLGEDGHPAKGGFLPPIPLPRRMWAGGSVRFDGPLRLGDPVEKVSTILTIEEKTGRSGPLVFVALEHRISGPDGVAIVERQDLVYREPATNSPALPEPLSEVPDCDAHEVVIPDPVMLFRYSALTMNGHRIHYDRPYAMNEEAYPALVVHGPLQATLLAALAERHSGRTVRTFAFRSQSPAFDGIPLHLCCSGEGGLLELATRQGAGPCMTATATF